MARREFKASTARSDLERAVSELAQDALDVGPGAGEVAGGSAEVQLAMADLVSDANGEIVIFNDSGFHTLALRTDAAVVADGRAKRHVTAGGEDVTGYKYLTFDNGLTLYFEEGLNLILEGKGAGSAA